MQNLIDNEYFTLTQYSKEKETPIFILPPFAGRNGSVAKNLINKCVSFNRPVYAYELKPATQKTKNLSIGGLVEIIKVCHNTISNIHKNREIELCGTCQGGWLASIYTAMNPKEIKRLSLFAAPINTNSGCGNAIEEYCQKYISIEYHKWLVALNAGIQPGISQWLAFASMNPKYVYFDRWQELLKHHINNDQAKLKKWKKINQWYDSPNDLAGVWFLDALENHFIKNKLYKGIWKIDNKTIDLSKIECAVYVFAGEDDEITCPEQARGILDKVSSKIKEFYLLDNAGHTRVFTGKKELDIFAKTMLS